MSTLPLRTAGVEVGEGREEKNEQIRGPVYIRAGVRSPPRSRPPSRRESDLLGDTVLIPSVRSDGKVEQARSAIHPPSLSLPALLLLPVVALLSALACVIPDTGLRGD